jgi:hypothetical protein
MIIENNFIVVADGALIDPVLKLRLSFGRWEPGYGGAITATQVLKLHYDPEIQADRMTMPLPEDRRKRLLLLGPIIKDWQVFESDQSRKILELILNIMRGDQEVKLLISAGEHGFKLKNSLLQQKVPEEIQRNSYNIIKYVLESSLIFPLWDKEEGNGGRRTSISLYIERPLADELAANTDFNFDRSLDGPVLVVSRELLP